MDRVARNYSLKMRKFGFSMNIMRILLNKLNNKLFNKPLDTITSVLPNKGLYFFIFCGAFISEMENYLALLLTKPAALGYVSVQQMAT